MVSSIQLYPTPFVAVLWPLNYERCLSIYDPVQTKYEFQKIVYVRKLRFLSIITRACQMDDGYIKHESTENAPCRSDETGFATFL